MSLSTVTRSPDWVRIARSALRAECLQHFSFQVARQITLRVETLMNLDDFAIGSNDDRCWNSVESVLLDDIAFEVEQRLEHEALLRPELGRLLCGIFATVPHVDAEDFDGLLGFCDPLGKLIDRWQPLAAWAAVGLCALPADAHNHSGCTDALCKTFGGSDCAA